MKSLFATISTLILALNFAFCAFATASQEETDTNPLRTLYEAVTKIAINKTSLELRTGKQLKCQSLERN
ncbi:MAG: hypothetical protein IJ948_02660 [Clostridia bacterium]|nr:hypothetical protein [Clostridia bacterium]